MIHLSLHLQCNPDEINSDVQTCTNTQENVGKVVACNFDERRQWRWWEDDEERSSSRLREKKMLAVGVQTLV